MSCSSVAVMTRRRRRVHQFRLPRRRGAGGESGYAPSGRGGQHNRATNAVVTRIATAASYGYNAAGCMTNISYGDGNGGLAVCLTWNGQYQFTASSTNGVTFGSGTAMSAADGAFNSTNEIAQAIFTPSFPAGERHVFYIHVKDSANHLCPFVAFVLNPTIDDILNRIQANYSLICAFNIILP